MAESGAVTFGIKMNLLQGDNATKMKVPVSEEVGLQVYLPPGIRGFLPAERDGDELVLFVTNMVKGPRPEGALAATAIDFHWLSGAAVPVESLPEPIEFELPINFTERMECSFWDDSLEEWSKKGVNVHANATLDNFLMCETYHLSLFGAIIEGVILTLKCSNFALFSGEALKNVFLGGWLQNTGGLIFLGLLVALLTCFASASRLDYKRAQAMSWRDEFFVVEKVNEDVEVDAEPSPLSDDDDIDNFEGGRPETITSAASRNANKLLLKSKESVTAAVACCLTSPEVREAIDDIGSAWFEYFAEVRGFFHALFEGHEGHSGLVSDSRFFRIVHNVMAHMLIVSSRRQTAASLGVSNHVVTYILECKDISNYLVDERVRLRREELAQRDGQQVREHPQQQNWRTSGSQLEAWENLRREVCDRIHERVHLHGSKHCAVAHSIAATFKGLNPAGEIFSLDIFQSCKAKVLVLACDVLGAFAFSCAFFEASGMVRGKPRVGETECEVGDALGRRLGRFLVIAFSCLVCASLPVVILNSLQTKKLVAVEGGLDSEAGQHQLRVWQIQGNMFWAFGTFYASICTLYVLAFLANIGDADHSDWSFMTLIALCQDFMVVPTAVAVVLAILMKILMLVAKNANGVDGHGLTRSVTDHLHDTSNMMLPIEMV